MRDYKKNIYEAASPITVNNVVTKLFNCKSPFAFLIIASSKNICAS